MAAINFNLAERQDVIQKTDAPEVLFLETIRKRTGGAPDFGKITSDKLIRFATSDRREDKSGWCKFFADGEGGVFGCWRQGISETWQARQPRTPEEKTSFMIRVKQAREESARIQEQERAVCRKKSAEIWTTAQPAPPDHTYLTRKRIKAHGLKIDVEGRLLSPLKDIDGTLHGLQRIDAEGGKRFLPGTEVTGCYHSLGVKLQGQIFIAEGYATGATLHEITGHAVAVAFNAGNLKPVAEALRRQYPACQIIVAADDDYLTEGNPGITKATEAAQAVNGLVAIPTFPTTRGPKDTDFNDLARLAGPEAVRACIEAVMLSGNAFSLSIVLTAAGLLARDIPRRESVIDQILLTQSLFMVFGFRGRGKTWFILCMLHAIATGRRFLSWAVSRARRVLYVDGEMAAVELQDRLKSIFGDDIPPMFEIIPSEFFYSEEGTALTLDNIDHQNKFLALLCNLERAGRRPEVICFDNLSSMTDGEENSNDDPGGLHKFMRRLRHLGYTAGYVHHSGKNGEQRGDSRKEDFLDLSIKLKEPTFPTSDGAQFIMEFSKVRGKMPQPSELECSLVTNPETSCLELVSSCTSMNAPQKWVTTLHWVAMNRPTEQQPIADALQVTRQAVSKSLNVARRKGFIEGLELTKAGANYLRKIYGYAAFDEVE